MIRLQWLTAWDQLRERLSERTSWGRTQILELMTEIEMKLVRENEYEKTV